MGISADIITFKCLTEREAKEYLLEEKVFYKTEWYLEFQLGEHPLRDEIAKKLKDCKYIEVKDIFYLGSRKKFKDDVFDDYSSHRGFLSFEEGWEYLIDEAKKEFIAKISNLWETEDEKDILEFFKSGNYYIDLGV